jgi:N-acetylglucosaminyl-diphospho-decaprenol L-rhamnosyltransferase
MSSAAEPQVAIVTVTYRSAEDIEPFLLSVASAGSVARVVVVDNASDQTTTIVERARRLGARVIELGDNSGYGRAVNAGVESLPPEIEFALVSNPDVRLHDDSVAKLVAVLSAHPEVGAVGPKILNEDGSIYPSARRVPSIRTGVGHAVFSRISPTNPWTRSYRQEAESTETARNVGWLSGSCLLVRRGAFADIGGFDEGYFMYFEDVDLGYRMGKAGWLNRYDPSATVTHVGGTSTSTAASPMLIAHHRSADRFLASKYRGWYLAPLRWMLHVGLELRARWLTRWQHPRSR